MESSLADADNAAFTCRLLSLGRKRRVNEEKCDDSSPLLPNPRWLLVISTSSNTVPNDKGADVVAWERTATVFALR